ncbi:MAG: type II secretion system inner membrane protein GspF [Parvularculaceae bacterium]
MAAFEYVALDPDGRRRKGVIAADSPRLARRELRMRSLAPLKVTPAARGTTAPSRFAARAGVSPQEVALATRQLATLIEAAAPVEEALHAVAQQSAKQSVRSILMNIRARVMEGYRLSEALKEHPRVFSPLYRAMIGAGESSGELGVVMRRLADYLDKAQAMRRQIATALVYPAALAAVAVAVVIALMTFVVPKVAEQFDTLGQDLPWITEAMIGLSAAIRDWGGVAALIAAAAGFGASRALRRPRIRRAADAALLRAPLVGRLVRGVNAARFARTLATLVQSGAPILESLDAARETVRNAALREAVDEIVARVREGAALSSALRKSDMFPPLMAYMTASGERSGALAEMLVKAADHLEAEFESVTALALKILEPAIIVAMGGVVLVIVLAILTPILRLNALALS